VFCITLIGRFRIKILPFKAIDMRTILSLVVFTTIFAAPVLADDFHASAAQNWHQWRGPNANGTADLANPPVEWDESKNIKWKVEIPGKGTSTPIVWQDRVFVLTAIKTERQKEGTETVEVAAQQTAQRERPENRGRRGEGGRRRGGRGRFGGGPPPTNFYQFAVICYDRESGKQIWQQIAADEVPHEAGHNTNTFASYSPTTDGQRLYVSFGSHGIFCFDMDGNPQWNRSFGKMRTAASFGEGSSPALHGDTLVVPWDHEGDSFIVALDAKTGKDKWKVDRDERTTWSTPFIVEYDGRTQVVTNGAKRVRSYDLATGELIWECGGQTGNPIPSPVRQDDLVVCMTGWRASAIYAIPLNATGDITDSDKIAWNNTEAAPYVPSPVLYEGQLYFTKSRDGILSSRDAKTGDELIGQTRLPGIRTLYASPVAAADRIYFTGRGGTTLVLKHGPELDVIATNKLDETIDASPALVGNELFMRGEKHLYCIAAK
jgi:outer membrane protein assembly factor BamB